MALSDSVLKMQRKGSDRTTVSAQSICKTGRQADSALQSAEVLSLPHRQSDRKSRLLGLSSARQAWKVRLNRHAL